MGKLFLLLIVLTISSCAAQRTEFICIADVDKNSECKIIPCADVGEICKTGKYRILKNYMTGYAYIYSTDPFTDIRRCKETALGEK